MHNVCRFLQAVVLTALLSLVGLVPTSQAQGEAPVEQGQSFTGRVVSVTDGDTYDVRRSIGGMVTIRLYGVDVSRTYCPKRFGRVVM
jgi:endonuclease YncB( thermonuclease family)